MLDPGLYYIDSVQLRTEIKIIGKTTYKTHRKLGSPGVKYGIIRYGAFRVYPNKVHYFNEINYFDRKPSLIKTT